MSQRRERALWRPDDALGDIATVRLRRRADVAAELTAPGLPESVMGHPVESAGLVQVARVARPEPVLRRRDQPGPDRVEVDVPADGPVVA